MVELTHVQINYTTPSSPPSTEQSFQITPTSPPNTQNIGSLAPSTPTSPKVMDMAIPTDIRISGLLCLKNFVLV